MCNLCKLLTLPCEITQIATWDGLIVKHQSLKIFAVLVFSSVHVFTALFSGLKLSAKLWNDDILL